MTYYTSFVEKIPVYLTRFKPLKLVNSPWIMINFCLSVSAINVNICCVLHLNVQNAGHLYSCAYYIYVPYLYMECLLELVLRTPHFLALCWAWL